MWWEFARAARFALLGTLLSFPISLALVVGPLAAPANASATDALLLTNQLRSAIGSPTVAADPRLTQAAHNHANYSSEHGDGGQFDTAGLPYYTGCCGRERLSANGSSTSLV